jgi:hypothetical protein
MKIASTIAAANTVRFIKPLTSSHWPPTTDLKPLT